MYEAITIFDDEPAAVAANLAAADANAGRLRKLQGFNQVVAPFDGVVTRRNVDVGDLINADVNKSVESLLKAESGEKK